jgi:hypothetical protein
VCTLNLRIYSTMMTYRVSLMKNQLQLIRTKSVHTGQLVSVERSGAEEEIATEPNEFIIFRISDKQD